MASPDPTGWRLSMTDVSAFLSLTIGAKVTRALPGGDGRPQIAERLFGSVADGGWIARVPAASAVPSPSCRLTSLAAESRSSSCDVELVHWNQQVSPAGAR